MPDPRAGNAVALTRMVHLPLVEFETSADMYRIKEYVAACAADNATVNTTAALVLPSNWDGPFGQFLNTGGTVFGVIVSLVLGVGAIEIAVCSTGLIGERLPMKEVLFGVETAVEELADSEQAGLDAATAVLTGIAPSSSQGASARPSAPAAVVVNGSDFATTTRVRLTATPGRAGPNRFDVAITDYDTREPLAARRVTLRFQLVGRGDVAPSTLALRRAGTR